MFEDEIIINKALSVCGINCALCSAFLRKSNNCAGCQAPTKLITRRSCQNCLIRNCALNQGFEYCFQCADYPCSKVKNINQRYLKKYQIDLVENNRLAKVDMVNFIKVQLQQFTCHHCGAIVDQHNHKCSECHKIQE